MIRAHRCFRYQPLAQLRPPPPPRHVTHRDGDGFPLSDQHHKPLAARDASVEQVSLQHRVKLREYRDDHGGIFRRKVEKFGLFTRMLLSSMPSRKWLKRKSDRSRHENILRNLLRSPNWLFGSWFRRSGYWLGYHNWVGDRLRNVDGFRAGLMSTNHV